MTLREAIYALAVSQNRDPAEVRKTTVRDFVGLTEEYERMDRQRKTMEAGARR